MQEKIKAQGFFDKEIKEAKETVKRIEEKLDKSIEIANQALEIAKINNQAIIELHLVLPVLSESLSDIQETSSNTEMDTLKIKTVLKTLSKEIKRIALATIPIKKTKFPVKTKKDAEK